MYYLVEQINYIGFFVLLSILHTLDAATTFYVLKRGGQELNPVVNSLIKKLHSFSLKYPKLGENFGMYVGILIPKIIYMTVLWYYPINTIGQVILLVFFAAVVIWNTKQLLDTKRLAK